MRYYKRRYTQEKAKNMHQKLHISKIIYIFANRMMKKALLSVVFPSICPCCGQVVVEEEGQICSSCLSRLPQTEQIQTRGNLTEDKFVNIPNFVRGAAWLHYGEDKVRNLIQQMKYKNRPMIGYHLGKTLGQLLGEAGFMDGIDLIIPIPLHPKRLRERGYNQAEYIAKGISEATDIPMDYLDHIQRLINNPHQARLLVGGRKQNVSHIFAVNHPEELYRKHILLVDDVITTGSTLQSCIKAMIPIKGCQISVVTVAKAH